MRKRGRWRCSRLANPEQLTTDGFAWYVSAVESAFGLNGVDFAQIIKTYGTPLEETATHRRYSPSVSTGAITPPIMGEPDAQNVSTSLVQRLNLGLRLQQRPDMRLANGFSKKAANIAHAFSLHAMFYNYCRPHTKLTKEAKGTRTTPAMAAGVARHVWTVADIVERLDPKRRIRTN